jgi:hypothetical protein
VTLLAALSFWLLSLGRAKGEKMEAQIVHPAPAASVASAGTAATAFSPLVHVIRPDVYVVEKAKDNFWTTQAPPLVAVLTVLIAVVVKWVWDSRDRKYQLKRELYLELADAITEWMNVIASFASAEKPLAELADRFIKATAVFAKVEVVANAKMLDALHDLTDQGGKVYQEVFRERIAIEKYRADMQVCAPFIQQHQNSIDAVLAEQKRMNLDGVQDPARFERLRGQYEFSRQHLAELTDKTQRSLRGINDAIAKITELMMVRRIELIPVIERVKQRMRAELGFSYDFDASVARQQASAQKVRDELAATQATVRKTFTPDDAQKLP